MDGSLLEWSWSLFKRVGHEKIEIWKYHSKFSIEIFFPLNRYRKLKKTETDTAFLRRTHERSREVEPGSVGQRKEIKKKNNCTG